MSDQPTPEQAVASGVLPASAALKAAQTRKEMMANYVPTVSNPDGLKPYAEVFLGVNERSIALLEAVEGIPDEQTRRQLEEIGKELTQAAMMMVKFQVENNCWSA